MMGDVGRGPFTLWGHGGGIMEAKKYPAQSGAKPFEACEARKNKPFCSGLERDLSFCRGITWKRIV